MAGKSSRWMSEKALAKLRQMPRVAIYNLKPHPQPLIGPETRPPRIHGRSHPGGKTKGWLKNEGRNVYHNRIGFEAFRTPMAYKTKVEPSYNYGWQ